VFTPAALRPWLDGDGTAIGRRVAVLGGGKAALSLASLAATRGHEVTVIEPSGVFGLELGLPGRFRTVADLEALGVRLLPHAVARAIDVGAVTVDVAGSADKVGADTVIVTADTAPDAGLAQALAADGIAAHVVGDCRELRGIEGANLDAAAVALALA
jgi:NADPH-dependent 2,4-dienoyl-CoA reductase/sulfur reductase-like enzyme